MIIKFLAKQYTIELKDLPEKNIGALKEQIKKQIPQCAKLSNDKIMLFYKKAKISSDDKLSLDDESVGFTDESTVFVVVVSGDAPKQDEPKKQEQQTSTRKPDANNNIYGMQNPGVNASDPNVSMLEHMLNNPEMMEQAIEMAMPNATPEQKAMFRESAEAMRKNPELMKQMMANMQHSGYGMPMMQPNPMMSPMMQPNPMMSPMMPPSPMMNQGYNPYMYNPYMYNPYQQQVQQQAPPANGPCSHGFYPPKIVDGKPVPQDAETVYADKLSALNDMGFSDKESCLKALVAAKGDISEAIEILTRKLNN